MTQPLVECIPNFSEARRAEVIDAIIQAITSVPTAILLDRHSDSDHNRTVLTFVAPPEDVGEAAFRAIAKAAELIDLNQHRGEHPRIGATDVVPFVPISGVSMSDCVEIARQLGQRVGEELNIPVYLYEEAATRPDRRNLEDIRRGEYEGLKKEIATNPERKPDYGPSALGGAGATVIGARHPLIAYNVYLTSDDVSIAEKIARAIRHSSGGLRYVKALGMLVNGMAQVSMNLTNYQKTPLARVIELIRREAQRYGVNIHHSELVGLIPQQALIDAAQWYLQLDPFEPHQVLETRLAAVRAKEGEKQPVTTPFYTLFLDALAASTPTPGGGSAAAYSGAAGAALVAMVARLTLGKPKYQAVAAEMRTILQRAETLRAELTSAIQEDAQAFDRVLEAYLLPKGTAKEKTKREKAIQKATLEAAQVPLSVAQKAVEVIELAEQVIAQGNINAISDGATGAALARAALSGAGLNVRINIANIKNTRWTQPILEKIRQLEQQADEAEKRIRELLIRRGGLALD